MRLSLLTLGQIMAQLGFTAQRLLHCVYGQDGALVERWMNSDLVDEGLGRRHGGGSGWLARPL